MIEFKKNILLFYNRALSFLYRFYWLSILSRTPLKVIGFLIQSSKNIHSKFVFTLNGIKIKFRTTDANIIEEIFFNREYDFLKDYITSIDTPVVLDLGAHVGAFSIWVLNNNRSAKLISIEADPDTFSILSENKLSSSIAIPDITWETHNLLAWGSDNKLKNFSQDGPSMSHKADTSGSILVKTINLPNLLNLPSIGNNKIDILKIDIEGSEEDFLCENPDSLSKVKCLVVELHPYLCNTERVIRVLNNHFTNITEIEDRYSSKPLLYCY